ncbi:hypothetical protein VTN77DRAFT_4130 [Rasamsonia byssochlamydoides]|uniref:uncharacterized protein n=1 Tax=Rasamsonia byssochlamydoides TaxID=89139 RepID=UPI003742A9C8
MARSGCSRPSRRGWTLDNFTRPPLFTLISLILLGYCCSIVRALENSVGDPSEVAEGNMVARSDEIIADRRYPPSIPREASNANANEIDVDVLVANGEDKRDTDDGSLRELTPTAVKRSSSSSTSADSAFPSPFETLGNNFTTTSCPQFFANFLDDSTFKSCYAISLLLQNSNSFFQALHSAVSLDQIVETSCSANLSTCSAYMSKLASDLINKDACGQDYSLGNPLVVQAYTGMLAYEPIYHATCLKDPSTENFCFTEAAMNETNVTDYYVYFLPLGMPLPGSSRPTCNECLQATMEVFMQRALIKGQPLTQTYIPAAEQINLGCGPDFVNASVKVGIKSASAGSLTRDPPTVTFFLGYALLFSVALGIL